MKKIIMILIIAGILVGTGYYFWSHRHEYFFQGELKNIEENKSEPEKGNNNSGEQGNTENAESFSSNNTESKAGIYQDNYTEKPYEKILQEDCERNCLNKKGTSDYEYCLEICGLNDGYQNAETENGNQEEGNTEEPQEDCGQLNGFEKDVCFKRKAVAEKDDNICENITDSNLKESCKDRVLEEIMQEWQVEPL